MEAAKEQVQDASLDAVQYRLHVRQKIQQGIEDVGVGRIVSHADVKQRLAKLITK